MVRLKATPYRSLPKGYFEKITLKSRPGFRGDPDQGSLDDVKPGDVEVDDGGYQDPPLTEVQKNGGAAPVAVIQEYVAKRWGRLRKRDGSRYTYDYRRVISASLANTSNINPLFERHPNNEGWWILGIRASNPDIQAAIEAPESPPPEDERSEEEEAEEEAREDRPKRRALDLERGAKRIKAEDEPDPQHLPTLIALAISEGRGSATAEEINETVFAFLRSRGWYADEKGISKNKPGKLSGYQLARAIELCLPGTGSITFQMDPNPDRPDYWMIDKYDPTFPGVAGLQESFSTRAQRHKRSQISMQELLMTTLLRHGGACDFETIYADVTQAPSWKLLKKNGLELRSTAGDTEPATWHWVRSGILRLNHQRRHYRPTPGLNCSRTNQTGSADDKRAILASLSHNPPGNFKKDPRRENYWLVAPRAMDWAQSLCEGEPAFSLSNMPA